MMMLAGPIGYSPAIGAEELWDWRELGVSPAGRIEEYSSAGLTDAWQFEGWETEEPLEELLGSIVVGGGYSISGQSPGGYAWLTSTDHDSAWARYVAESNALRGLSPEGLPLASRGDGMQRSTSPEAAGDVARGIVAVLRSGSLEYGPVWMEFTRRWREGPAEEPVGVSEVPSPRNYSLMAGGFRPVVAFAMAEPATVPEPGSLLLGAMGIAAAALLRKRSR